MQITIALPGLDSVTKRYVFIPNNTARPDVGGQWYYIDIEPILVWRDDNADSIVASAAAYFHTLQTWANISESMFKAVTATLIEREEGRTTNSKTAIKEFALPRNTDYAFWARQTNWLRAAVRTMEIAVIPLCQTFSANRRLRPSYHTTGEQR